MGRPPAAVLVLAAAAAIGAAGTGVVLGAGDGGERAAERRVSCDLVASPHGSDRGDGSRRRPFRTVPRLIRALEPGQAGCLREGTYAGSVEIGRRGTASSPITLQAYPDERARIAGRLWLNRHSAHIVIRGLYLDGRNRSDLPSPTVNGRAIRFVENDVTNGHTGICFVLGHPRYGAARGVTIQRNRVHDCGRLPATNHDHGVYVGVARDTRVVGNWIYDNADFGVHLYPDARRTTVAGNVIHANGEGVIFGGKSDVASRDNVVRGNVISSSRLRFNVESYFERGDPIGSGNVVRGNCIGGGARDWGNGGVSPPIGFVEFDNVIAEAAFASDEPGDLRLAPDSPCRAVFAGDPDRIPGPSA